MEIIGPDKAVHSLYNYTDENLEDLVKFIEYVNNGILNRSLYSLEKYEKGRVIKHWFKPDKYAPQIALKIYKLPYLETKLCKVVESLYEQAGWESIELHDSWSSYNTTMTLYYPGDICDQIITKSKEETEEFIQKINKTLVLHKS